MAIPKSNIRGLQDIRTLSGRADPVSEPYQIYMRLSCLGMEKVRRAKERDSAVHRISGIDSRLRNIEVEKADLLKILGEQDSGDPTVAPGVEPKPAPRRGGVGLKIRY
ncbi:MAG: hypothetical protein ABIG68_00215 [Acidobacteriota bacterium]